jgi:hypothetical protein
LDKIAEKSRLADENLADVHQESATDSDCDGNSDLLDLCDNERNEVLAPIGIAEYFSDEELPPAHTRRDLIPIYDVNRNVPSHLIWNNQYNVMRRGSRFSDVHSNAIIEHIVALTNSPSVSLLYPEGQLFPRIFWCSLSGSVVGAMPSFCLNTGIKCPADIASITQHQYIRIRDGDILTSRESPYWHYMFDVKLNAKLNKVPSRIVFKRGLEAMEGNKSSLIIGEGTSDAHLPMDEAEATRRIKELASLLKKGKWTYFMTLTVNDAETPGVREITLAIRDLASGDAVKERELTENFLPFVLRAWERFVRFFCQELIMRNASIVGHVKNLFYRFEFQGAGAKGNKPHVHCGITLYPESDIVSVSRICCSSTSFHTSLYNADFDRLLSEGIVSDYDDYQRWEQIVSNVNIHNCNAAQFRCMKATNAAGEKICRYRRQPDLPVEADSRGWFEEIVMPYPDDVYKILQELNLASTRYDQILNADRWFVDDALKAGKWHYCARNDEFFLASIPLVSAICRSSTNVDMCDRKFQVSYLVKYISGKEEHQLVDVAASKDMTQVTLHTQPHAHEKITHCQQIMANKRQKSSTFGREICLAEVVWFLLDLPYTYCNAEFVHVATVPLETRVGIFQRLRNESKHLLGETTDDIPPVRGRVEANLPDWRLFTCSQLAHIEDYRRSPYWCDLTSSFNVRPPELLFFDNLQVYSECFVIKSSQESHFYSDAGNQPWFDGLSRRIFLRSSSVDKAVDFVQRKVNDGDARAIEMMQKVFQPIKLHVAESWERFVHITSGANVVSVISLVKPWDQQKFMSHLCMSLGQYETEIDLFMNQTLSMAFVKAGLLPNKSCFTRADVLPILKRYILEDLRFHPISARQFAKYVRAASCAVNNVIEGNSVGQYTPCVIDVMLKEQASHIVYQQEALRKANIITALQDDPAISNSLPPNLMSASISEPLDWIPRISALDNVAGNSFAEQSSALDLCIHAINRLSSPSCRQVQFPCLVGRPGSGKSHVLKLATAYALSRGLQVELMSLTSQRSRQLGGNHLHLVFPFVVNANRVQFQHSMAASCLQRLDKDPVRTAIIKRTDIFIFEEIGLLSAEYFSALDNVLKRLMETESPMGGKLLLSCGDSKQLPPINGRPIWSSLNMCTLMQVFVFANDVRARDDQQLQHLISDCRRQLTADECTAVATTVLRECRFEDDWSSVPDLALRIVPTKAAENAVMEQFLQGRQTTSFTAIDEVQNGSIWERATQRITSQLNKNCYEYDICKLYVNAVVRMTYNCRKEDGSTIFSQGQIAVVTQLPNERDDFTQQRLTLRLAPPGERHMDSADVTKNWPVVHVGTRTTLPSVVGSSLQMGRRTQFPVRYYLASTIHRIQGDTVQLLATEMSLARREYCLWQREQFAVLISRVQRCQDLIFVGSRQQTRAAIEHIMRRTSKWDALIDHYLTELHVDTVSHRANNLDLDVHPFLPMYRELPTVSCGYVYMLVSIPCAGRFYLGEASNLKRSLRRHNTGYGTEETQNTVLHPWGVFVFVYGFYRDRAEDASEDRKVFLQEWRNTVSEQTSVHQAYDVGLRLANEWLVRTGCKLTVVKCGQFNT